MNTMYHDRIFDFIQNNEFEKGLKFIEDKLEISPSDICQLKILKLIIYQYIGKVGIENYLDEISNECQYNSGESLMLARFYLEIFDYKKAESFFNLAYIQEVHEETMWSRDIILPLWAYTLCKLKQFDKAKHVIEKEDTLSDEETTMFFSEKKFSYVTKKNIYDAIENKSTYFPREAK